MFNIFIRIPNKNKTLQKICLDKKLGVHRMGGKHLHCSISKAEGSGGGGGRCTYKPHFMAFHLNHMSKEAYNVVYFLRNSFLAFLDFFDKTFEPQLGLTG